MTRPKHAPSFTLDCIPCGETYFSKSAGPHTCDLCGGALLVRREGAEPFEAGSYAEAGLQSAVGLATLPMFSGGEQA